MGVISEGESQAFWWWALCKERAGARQMEGSFGDGRLEPDQR